MKIIHEIINLGKGTYGAGEIQILPENLLKIYDQREAATIPGTGGGGNTGGGNTNITEGHIIRDQNSNIMTQQPFLKFERMVVTNDPTNTQTLVSRPPMLVTSQNPPLNPIQGDGWINNITWKSYIFYDNYWVEQLRATINNESEANVIVGTPNYLPKYLSPTGLIESQIYDNGTNVGIFTNNPLFDFHILKNGVNLELVTETATPNRYATNNVLSDVSGASIASFGSMYPESGGSRWAGRSGLYINTGRPNQTLNLWIGTRTILNSLPDGKTAIGQNDPTNWLDIQGDLRIRTINNLNTTPSNVLVSDANGVVHQRTLSEFGADIGGSITGSTVSAGAGLSIDGDGNIQLGKEETLGVQFIDINEIFTGDEKRLSIYTDWNAIWNSTGQTFSGMDIQQDLGFTTVFLTSTFDTNKYSSISVVSFDNEASAYMVVDRFSDSTQIRFEINTNTGSVFTDSINSKGLVYASDYSANGTLDPRWIPDWGAVTGLTSTIGGIYGLTINRLPKATSSTAIGDSRLIDDGTCAYFINQNTSTFFGKDAGLSASAFPTLHAFFGQNAGKLSNGASTQNSFFGANAGSSNSDGSFNSYFGQSAGSQNVSGDNNVAIGRAAGVFSTIGSNNIFIGERAGAEILTPVNLTIVDNSIFIGRNTKANNNSQTNQIVIGHEAIGNGSNTVTLGNTSIILTVLRGTVNMAGLPTSSIGLNPGDIWNNGGVLNIV